MATYNLVTCYAVRAHVAVCTKKAIELLNKIHIKGCLSVERLASIHKLFERIKLSFTINLVCYNRELSGFFVVFLLHSLITVSFKCAEDGSFCQIAS